WIHELRGLTLPDVAVRVDEGRATLAARRGSLLFAHFGLSGPVILDVSRVVSRHPNPLNLTMEIDLLPALGEPEVDRFLREESGAPGKKQLAAVLAMHLPRRLCEIVLTLAGLSLDRKAAALSRGER